MEKRPIFEMHNRLTHSVYNTFSCASCCFASFNIVFSTYLEKGHLSYEGNTLNAAANILKLKTALKAVAPYIIMKTSNILGITLILLAAVSLIQGVAVLWIISAMQAAMAGNPLMGMALGAVSPFLMFGAIFGTLQVLLGIAALVSGILLLSGKGLK